MSSHASPTAYSGIMALLSPPALENQMHRHGALAVLALFLYGTNDGFVSPGLKVFIWAVLWYSTGGRYWLYLLRNTIRRDIRLFVRGLTILAYLFYFKRRGVRITGRFRTLVRRHPDRVAFINATTDEEWTYRRLEDYSNRVANHFLSRGFRRGDSVALFMDNRPEYIGIWLGLAKIGVISALINYNLRSKSFLHTLVIGECRAVVYGLEFEDAVREIKDDVMSANKDKFDFYFTTAGSGIQNNNSSMLRESRSLDKDVALASPQSEPESISREIHPLDTIFYIYTSGTTGMPKAVKISHIR